ncbi:MAG: permease [Thermoplasmata archaeon]
MNIKERLKNNKIAVFTLCLYTFVLLYEKRIFIEAMEITWMYIREMLEVLPAVFIITGLIEVWVPKETIMKNFGSDSGLRGKSISVLIGSVSAGPIYAAFPVTRSLLRKGASLANVVIILSAWAVIKVPMLIVESKFLGFQFMVVRYLLTVPGIMLIGFATERFVSRDEVVEAGGEVDIIIDRIENALPGYNCGSCGFKGCAECAERIYDGDVDTDICDPGGEEVAKEIDTILNIN